MCISNDRLELPAERIGELEEFDDSEVEDDYEENSSNNETDDDSDNEAQSQGTPEVYVMSWRSCPSTGGLELFVIGKHFMKDTKVIFYEGAADRKTWCATVTPMASFLNQCHLVCVVPPFGRLNIPAPVRVSIVVESGYRKSSPQPFTYTPIVGYIPETPTDISIHREPVLQKVFLIDSLQKRPALQK